MPGFNSVVVPRILLVDRGECSFVTKVRNGERAGASSVIVIDDRFEDIQDVIMSDDGFGYNVRVPSMIIDKATGSLLKKFAQDGENVSLQVSFERRALKEKVQVDLWYSSNNGPALDFIRDFGVHVTELKDHIDFTPRFISWSCP